jgi:hypothetical protein
MKCVYVLARGKPHVDINVMIWNSYVKSGFLHRRLSNQGFQADCSACQTFSVFSSPSISFFQARSPADPMFSYKTSDMKYIDTINVTEDSVYPYYGEKSSSQDWRTVATPTTDCELSLPLHFRTAQPKI